MATAILDYDGYICKSFYANKDDMMNFEKAEEILSDLENAAFKKINRMYPKQNNKIIKVVSGHSWKKDIYPSYKRTRKRDEFLGIYRSSIIENYKGITIVDQLEADEVIVMIADWLRATNEDFIVFSDDKDLRYYVENYCKINILEEPVLQDPQALVYNQLEQMLVGDKEDNIQGVDKVGEKTAPKLLKQYGYSLAGAVKIFKDKGIEIDRTLRDLLLIIPMSDTYTLETEPSYRVASSIIKKEKANPLDVHNAMIAQVQYLNKIVTEIYNTED